MVAFANLAQIYFIDKEISYPLRDYMQENCANLVGHVNRMKERWEHAYYVWVSSFRTPVLKGDLNVRKPT